jgi:8-oxo-dGTP diphosphatase
MNNISLGVRALIKTDKGLIMVEHNEEKNGEILIFPGGGMESGENIFKAIEREVKEETNLIVKSEKIIYIRETFYNGDSGIEFYIICSLIGGNLLLGVDPELEDNKQILQGVREVNWNEIKNNKWYPEELHDRLEGDLKNNIDTILYLGIKDFS